MIISLNLLNLIKFKLKKRIYSFNLNKFIEIIIKNYQFKVF